MDEVQLSAANRAVCLNVSLGERSYPIYIGQGILDGGVDVPAFVHGKQVMLVTNETIAPLYLDKAMSLFSQYECHSVVLPDGESFKNIDVLNQVFDSLLQQRLNRTVTLVALGGGVVGDMTGFAAACYQRGVNFIQIPTTLLSQVDSSVGGKTGVNHAMGKNMIGAFHQPQAVLADTNTLNTLDDRQLSAGLAEVIKYGLIADAEFFEWLESNYSRLLNREPQALATAIYRSCVNKAQVVAQDEREAGIRAILNLGHTFGHAIETAQNYTDWLHGEAIAAGMVMAAEMSEQLGWINGSVVSRARDLLSACGLPVCGPAKMSSDDYLSLMAVDKKVLNGSLRLVLLKDLGEAVVTSDFDTTCLRHVLDKHTA